MSTHYENGKGKEPRPKVFRGKDLPQFFASLVGAEEVAVTYKDGRGKKNMWGKLVPNTNGHLHIKSYGLDNQDIRIENSKITAGRVIR